MIEPEITINGVTLSPGQAMTIRVAIESFCFDLTEHGLGSDHLGKRLRRGYLDRIREIRELIARKS